MITVADDKMVGFTKKYADQLKHNCGTCFSGGPVDVGLTADINGTPVYTCAKCVEKVAAVKIQEEADLQAKFATRWMGGSSD